VAGVDEAGRGALFGPVVAAAVILREALHLQAYRDSKTLTEAQRESLFERLCGEGHSWAVGEVSAREIDETDILRSTLKSMALAVEGLPSPPDCVLVDGNHRPLLPCACEAVVGGDARSVSIAAASIVAKVYRDRLVRALDREYPGYGLGRHKGYGTAEHLAAIRRMGPTPLHRRTFRGVVTEG
jgi:ribonuclease HII